MNIYSTFALACTPPEVAGQRMEFVLMAAEFLLINLINHKLMNKYEYV